MSTAELADRLQAHSLLLLDARRLEEYQVSHLPNAQWITDSFNETAPDLPTQDIVIYCSIGYRSARWVQRLQAQGYTNVWNLEGSIFQWANEDRPLYRTTEAGECLVLQVHPYSSFWQFLIDPDYPVADSTSDRSK